MKKIKNQDVFLKKKKLSGCEVQMRQRVSQFFWIISLFLGVFFISFEAFSNISDPKDDDIVSLSETFNYFKEEIRKKAIENGISASFLNKVIPQMELLHSVKKADREQSEFLLTFWDYTDRTISPYRIQKGKEMMRTHRVLLDRISKKYKVPKHYLVAFWGLETNYGQFKGNVDTLNALVTLAYDQRRRSFFTRELLTFLKIMEREQVSSIKGSWAGAFGNFQFMPTTFEAYAVDEDQDGRKDIINSLPDSFASAANYLSKMGWKEGEKWGREVRLTKPLDWNKISHDKPHTILEWSKMGVQPADGTKWKKNSLMMQASLILPMGVNGPAFLTYSNFNIIMRWNRSYLYALSVGILADRIGYKNAKGLIHRKRHKPLSRIEAKEIQSLLKEQGFYQGEIDGIIGSGTRKSIQRFQRTNKLPEDGHADDYLLDKLRGYNK